MNKDTVIKRTFDHVTYDWDDEVAKTRGGVGRLVYRSNLLGADRRITNTGGGNTSSKLTLKDPLTGEEALVLWVKGSGGDLRTARRENFASLYMHKLLALIDIYNRAETRGVKTQVEDDIVGIYPHTVFNLNPRASSIDTPLHAFIPYKHVDHTHPNAVLAIAAAKNSRELTQEIYGDEVGWLPWQRPGFDLGLKLREEIARHPGLKGIVLGQHGLINWEDDDKACYELTLELIEKAAHYLERFDKGASTFGGQKHPALDETQRKAVLADILPNLRGLLSQHHRFIGTVQATPEVLEFVNSEGATRLAELGTSCPDHFLRTKIKSLYVDWDPQAEDTAVLAEKLEQGLERYRRDYQAYYEACSHKHKEPQHLSGAATRPTMKLAAIPTPPHARPQSHHHPHSRHRPPSLGQEQE